MDTFKKTDSEIRPPTSLSDEEQMFREAVRDFATSEIAPLVSQMDRRQELDAGLLPQLFELGLMGIEIPEEFGGAGSNFFTSVREREQFGRPIGENQGVQFQLADAATELEASRLLVYNAARLKDAGEDFLVPAAMAKLHSSQMAQKVTSLCIDLYGGYGFTTEYPVEKFYRDARSARSTRARPICNSKPSPGCF